ncbi:hypothetical protein ABIA15_005257 [Sinorhizobium fredii]
MAGPTGAFRICRSKERQSRLSCTPCTRRVCPVRRRRNSQGSARDCHRPKKTSVALAVIAEGHFAVTAVCKTLGVARSNMAERAKQIPSKARGRPPLADWGLVEEIKAIIADMPTCGYRRVPTNEGRAWPNAKRVYRVIRLHGLRFQRHTGAIDTRRHDGRVAVEVSNLRWCSVRIPVKSAADPKRSRPPIPIAPAIATVAPTRRSAATTRCWPPAPQTPLRPTRMSGPMPASAPMPTA